MRENAKKKLKKDPDVKDVKGSDKKKSVSPAPREIAEEKPLTKT